MTNQNHHNLGPNWPISRGTMMLCNESRKAVAGLTHFLTPRKNIRLATWNIRTMYEAERTALVAKEMKHYNIRLLGLSKTRWLQTGQLRLTTGETLLFSGHTQKGAHHTEGVGLMLSLKAQYALIGWEPVNSRIITAKFNTNEIKIIF